LRSIATFACRVVSISESIAKLPCFCTCRFFAGVDPLTSGDVGSTTGAGSGGGALSFAFGTVPVAPRRSSTTDILSSPPGRSQTYEPSPSYTVSSPSASASCVASTSSFATAASTFDGQ
jgi:hypothetical protein